MPSKRRTLRAMAGWVVAVFLTACAGPGQAPILYDPLANISDLKVMEVQPFNVRETRATAWTRAVAQTPLWHTCSGLR